MRSSTKATKATKKEGRAMRLWSRTLPLPDPEQVRRRTRASFVANDGPRSML